MSSGHVPVWSAHVLRRTRLHQYHSTAEGPARQGVSRGTSHCTITRRCRRQKLRMVMIDPPPPGTIWRSRPKSSASTAPATLTSPPPARRLSPRRPGAPVKNVCLHTTRRDPTPPPIGIVSDPIKTGIGAQSLPPNCSLGDSSHPSQESVIALLTIRENHKLQIAKFRI